MKGLHKGTFSAWERVDDNAKKILKAYKFGGIVEFENKKKRNITFRRKFFAVINLTFKNQDLTDNFENFREAVIIEAGFYRFLPLIDGTLIKRANSINFASMDDVEFSDMYDIVFGVCLKILGCKSEELELELLQFS